MKNRRRATAKDTAQYIVEVIVEQLLILAVGLVAFGIPGFALAQLVIYMYS